MATSALALGDYKSFTSENFFVVMDSHGAYVSNAGGYDQPRVTVSLAPSYNPSTGIVTCGLDGVGSASNAHTTVYAIGARLYFTYEPLQR